MVIGLAWFVRRSAVLSLIGFVYKKENVIQVFFSLGDHVIKPLGMYLEA